ncbi:MAG: hypothetical protein ACYTBJ_25310 [Planctomycetota bacterium]|jgi:hypothetical protein
MAQKTYPIYDLVGRGQEPVKLFSYTFIDGSPQVGDEIWPFDFKPMRITRRIWDAKGHLMIIVTPVSGLVPA